MASIRKRGGVRGEVTFQISVSMGYDANGKQQRKFTTYTPPENVTAGKALKLAKEYAALWEDRINQYSQAVCSTRQAVFLCSNLPARTSPQGLDLNPTPIFSTTFRWAFPAKPPSRRPRNP